MALVLSVMNTLSDINRPVVNLPEIVSQVLPAVVYIECPNSWSGSGVIVSSNKVLTAGHIIKNASELRITTWDNKIYNSLVFYKDPDVDCGIIIIDGNFENIADLADSDEIKLGDKIFCVGSPGGKELFNTITSGVVSGLNRCIRDSVMATTDAQVDLGYSGGPVFNMQGKVIGILTATYGFARNGTVFLPIKACKRILNND